MRGNCASMEGVPLPWALAPPRAVALTHAGASRLAGIGTYAKRPGTQKSGQPSRMYLSYQTGRLFYGVLMAFFRLIIQIAR